MKKLIVLIAIAATAVFSLQAETPTNAEQNAAAQTAPAKAMEANATAENNESNVSAEDNGTQTTQAAPAAN